MFLESKKNNSCKSGVGFTIIELVISVSILSVAIIGIYASFSMMSVLSTEMSDRLIAVYLAQEGLEIVKNIRDTNWMSQDLEARSWDEGLSACENEPGCEVDYKTNGSAESPVYPWQERFLTTSSDAGFYGYSAGEETKFKRKITINKSSAPYALRVKAEVFWNSKPTIINPTGAEESIIVENILYDWY